MKYPTGWLHTWHDWLWSRTVLVDYDDDNLFGCIEYYRCLHCGSSKQAVKQFRKTHPGATLVKCDVSIAEPDYNPIPERQHGGV